MHVLMLFTLRILNTKVYHTGGPDMYMYSVESRRGILEDGRVNTTPLYRIPFMMRGSIFFAFL